MAANSDAEVLAQAGDYVLETLVLSSSQGDIDLKNFFQEMHLYEDVFSPALSGNVILADAINLISALPMRGDEELTLKCRTPTLLDSPANVIEKTFKVYSIKDRIANNDGSQFYNICFTSKESFVDNLTTISKTFRGTTDAVASQIYDDYVKIDRELNIYDTPHKSKLTYTSNYWTPFKNLSFISKRVRGSQFNGADQLFYESNKAFNFVSIEALIALQLQNGIFEEYVLERDSQSIPRRKSGFSFVGAVLPNRVTRIENIKIKKGLDYMDSQMSGMLASSIYGYDLSTKKFVQRNFDYVDECSTFTRTDTGKPFPSDTERNPKSHVDFVMYNTSLYNDYGKSDNENLGSGSTAEFYSDRHLFRNSYLNNLNNHVLEMTIPGRTDIQVGHLVSVLYPNTSVPDEETRDPDTIFDPFMTGAYLVTAIHHKFDTDRHVMITEVIKNGFKYDIGGG